MPAGRPTKYKKEYIKLAENLALLGCTDEEMARVLEIRLENFYKWQKRYPEFRQAILRGKDEADAKVVQALYERAKGYSHPETLYHVVSDGSGRGSSIVATETIKHYPPEVNALKFWLNNRQRGKWREKIETGFTDKDGNDIQPFLALPTDKLKQIEQLMNDETAENNETNTSGNKEGTV